MSPSSNLNAECVDEIKYTRTVVAIHTQMFGFNDFLKLLTSNFHSLLLYDFIHILLKLKQIC